jgi:acyl-coenzyme A thioesterase PaaI-like protein
MASSGPLQVGAEVLRAGRSVSLLTASLVDVTAGRPCATARAWAFPHADSGPGETRPLPHKPDDGVDETMPPTWSRGYVDHVEWRWIEGAFLRPGSATVWLRPRVPLLPGEEMTGLQRLMSCVDSASGVSAALDPGAWNFMNTELTVHVLREPVGEWVCLEAETTLGPSAVGVANARVHDERGLVATSAQALLVMPR